MGRTGFITWLAILATGGTLAAQEVELVEPAPEGAVPMMVEGDGMPIGELSAPVGLGCFGTGVPLIRPRGCCRGGWVNLEYLMFWVKDAPIRAPLLTSAPANTAANLPAGLGNPDTSILFGSENIDSGIHSGGRITAGLWLDPDRGIGLEGVYLFLGDNVQNRFVGSNGVVLGNPFVDVSGAPMEQVNLVADPAFGIGGTASMANRSRLQGAECNGVASMVDNGVWRIQGLCGFRFLEVQEGLTLTTQENNFGPLFFPGQYVLTVDDFDTQNSFWGGQLGTRAEYVRGRLIFGGSFKIAIGSMHQLVRTSGFTNTNTGPGFITGNPVGIPATTVQGGIYAQPTNIGTRDRDRFAVVPELNFQVGYALASWARVFCGYNFLYVSDVARPGDQISRRINSTQLVSFNGIPSTLVGNPQPQPRVQNTDYWAQGLNIGLGLNW